ncbi:MAG: hypothetical protein JSW66_05330 [Phycisphaerales bacterium]|nr:MAG: hypothetical protein JSW66_05330 [Phycisphaerales bacterium]
MAILLIGIDDTDNQSNPGTGRLARRLSDECARRGMSPLGVTRHQFHIDPAIPYTSHNSGACIALESEDEINSAKFMYDFVAGNCANGSDPGVCIAKASKMPDYIIEFAQRATQQVVTMPEAYWLAERASIALRGLGGTDQGVIGALGSVGLRASGSNGRFIDLPGLRELQGCVDAAAFDRIGVMVEYDRCERAPAANRRCETLGWVRPRLLGGKPVLPLEWCEQRNAWVPLDRKKAGSDGDGSRA